MQREINLGNGNCDRIFGLNYGSAFYSVDPEANGTEDIDLKVTSVKILCQPYFDGLNIEPGQESKFWDEAFSYHAEITVDKAD